MDIDSLMVVLKHNFRFSGSKIDFCDALREVGDVRSNCDKFLTKVFKG